MKTTWNRELVIRILPNRWLCLPSFRTLDREELDLIKLIDKKGDSK